MKRAFDFLVALSGLVLSLPLSLLFALAVYLEDGRPIFFVQERCGRGGKAFRIVKFRSMRRPRPGQAHRDMDLPPCEDPRLTKVGAVLRVTAMDELPSLLNILKGDMSFVGPRPLRRIVEDQERLRYQTIEEVPGYALRESVRPGLTGLAQVFAVKGVSRRNLFRFDRLYVLKRGFCLDVWLILLSFYITTVGRWENRRKKL